MMNKKCMLILITVMLSTMMLMVNALAAESGVNISTNETNPDQITTAAETIAINENASVINITNNSNETTVAETIIKEEQKKSSPGFSLTETMISVIILIMAYKIGRNIK